MNIKIKFHKHVMVTCYNCKKSRVNKYHYYALNRKNNMLSYAYFYYRSLTMLSYACTIFCIQIH